ncbi:putative nuclease sbcCD subunit C [Schistosoma mansoni]|uniref:putative nuclease sbcCD subunit C n=1 Tax=Schistosoma mansoni TaxID=6183 RepID=UPI0001A63185|nr:putative nuclease sbcCD subunit C [Schistosoma mansoni]|eukprot:XP_018653693.1 putative nuclease sbcCD subunit C [Schistosoma mansoni]
MSQAKLLTAAFTKIPQYEEHIAVQNLPFSVDPILLESDYQIILPPLVADKCTVSQQKCDSTNILQRLTSRRKEKHKSRLREWYEKLSEISQDIENQVKECCENTAHLLNTSWERQNQILNANLSDEIKQEFHELTDYLSKYSHLTPNELQIALQKEIFTIDIELLENRRELSNLIKNLHLGELMHQRFTNLTWSEQQSFNNLLSSENLIPSNNMEEFLENWNVKCKQLFTEWDEMNQDALNSIYKAYEDNSQQCIDQIQQMKNQLLDRKLIGSMDEIENLIKENCITLLGELQSQFENNLNYIDKILEYLEQWKNTTMLAMKEEVIVRKTEIDDEYELQLKLHEPRIDRVKEDIANVRLTELVLHQTRIDRHITSVNLILNEMKNNSTNSLIDTLNKSEEQMNESIQHSIDLTINKATKSSTLFVDGGNFSTVEAKKYTTVLNQLSKTIQSFQEEIIGSIESIEKERQLIIDNKLKQFESMLKPYLADVIYMENMIRCITNTKVQIKAQTEDSSSQSKLLTNQIEQLQSLLKSLYKTNDIVTNTLINITLMDSNQSHRDTIKEKRIQKDLIHKTIELFTIICINTSDRCIFLNCLRSQFVNNDDDVIITTRDQDEISNENNIGNSKENLVLNKTKLQSTLQTPTITIYSNRNEQMKRLNNQTLFTNINTQNVLQISRPGRLFTDDSYIQLVQNIFNEPNPLDENIGIPNQLVDNLSKRNDNKSYELANSNSNNNNKQVLLDDNQKLETIPVTKSTKSHRGKREMNSSTTNGTVLKTSRRKKNIPHTTTNKTIVKHNRPQAYYDVFGKDVTSQEDSVELSTSNMKQINIEQVTYIGRIQKICRENLHNALHLSENYYRQKGIRQPTHPDIIKSTFDDAANTIVINLKKLFTEAESYHHSCIKYSDQLRPELCNLSNQPQLITLLKQENEHNDVDNDDPLKSKNHILNKSSTLDKDHISTKIKEEDLDRGKRTWEGVQFSEPINTNLNKSKEKQSSLLKPSRNTNSNTIELNDTNQNENYCIEFQLFTQNLLEFIEMEYTSAIKDNEEYKQQWIESVNLLTKLN